MTLSEVRRLLMVIVAILLVVDGGMIAYAKFSSNYSGAATKHYLVIAFHAKKAETDKLKAWAQEHQIEIAVTKEKHKFPEPDGFLLVMSGSEDVLPSVYETAKYKKLPVKMSAEKDSIQYGSIIKSEKKAKALINKIDKEHQLRFTLEPSTKKVNKKGYRSELKQVLGKDIEDLKTFLDSEKFLDIKVKEVEKSEE